MRSQDLTSKRTIIATIIAADRLTITSSHMPSDSALTMVEYAEDPHSRSLAAPILRGLHM